MTSIVDVQFLHEFCEDKTKHFPDSELSKLNSAIEAVEDDVFFNTAPGDEVPLDQEMASHLESYSPGGKTEHKLWDKSDHSVDLYEPNEKIAVEVEKTEQKNIWKNLIKFSRGNSGDINYGCVVVPTNYTTSSQDLNLFAHARRALKFASPLIPIDDIAVIGYHDPR